MLFFRSAQILGNPKTLTQSRQDAKVFLEKTCTIFARRCSKAVSQCMDGTFCRLQAPCIQ